MKLQDGILLKHEKESAKLRIGGGSWTINLDKLKEPPQEIVYKTPLHTYRIPWVKAQDVGFQMTLGGENKLVVPIKHWDRE